MKELNNASLPLNFAEGKYSTESVRLPEGQYIIKIIATGPCIGKVLKGNEVLTEVDFSSYKLLSYNDLKISFILSSESAISLEVTPKREDIKVYSASLSSSILPVGVDEYPTPTGTINITENGENIDVKQYAKANVNVVPKYEPICFTSLEDGNTFRLNREISISVDNKQTWQTLAANTPSPVINTGEKIYFKSTDNALAFAGTTSNYYQFTTAKTCDVSGHPYSLYTEGSLYFFAYLFRSTKIVNASGLDLSTQVRTSNCYNSMFLSCTSLTTAPELPATTLADNCYKDMFNGCTSLVTAPELPATTLASYCYNEMFRSCTSLTTAPELPATTLADNCYNLMFYGCTSLVTAPKLPVITLASNCYSYMFSSCTSLTTAPELPATTLTSSCYRSMFEGCTSLVTAPELPAITLANSCYIDMFKGCTSLVTAPELTTTTLADYCYERMFEGCTSLKTAPELPATTLASNCYNGMFQNCTSLVTAPELPATTLTSNCYSYMFSSCTSLTTAPELPATTLTSSCYRSMFEGCTSLNYIKALFTTEPSTSYTRNWVSGVAATGTFVKNSEATWTTTGVNGIPTGWTVEEAA